jgi:hypothetical protein
MNVGYLRGRQNDHHVHLPLLADRLSRPKEASNLRLDRWGVLNVLVSPCLLFGTRQANL